MANRMVLCHNCGFRIRWKDGAWRKVINDVATCPDENGTAKHTIEVSK